MNFEDFELDTGFRPVFSSFPNTKSMAQKTVMPLGVFYSPLLVQVDELKKGNFPTCSKCKASVCKVEGNKSNQGQQWNCAFCGSPNIGAPGFGHTFVE